jgi:hypothetical protein
MQAADDQAKQAKYSEPIEANENGKDYDVYLDNDGHVVYGPNVLHRRSM